MSRMRNFACLAIVAIAIAGCTTVRYGGAPQPAFDIDKDLEELAARYSSVSQISTFYQAPSKEARNQFITTRLVQYNLRYIQFIRALGADKQQIDASTDFLLLGLNLAGTITGGAQAKTVLAATAAAIGGGKTIVDKDFFYERTVPALVAAMNAQRKVVLLRIVTGARQELPAYPLDQALSDLEDYYFAGTLQGAVIAIQSDSGKLEQQTIEKIRELSQVSEDDIATRARVRRTIVALIKSGDEAKISAVLAASKQSVAGDLDAKKKRLEDTARAANTPELVNALKASLASANVSLVD